MDWVESLKCQDCVVLNKKLELFDLLKQKCCKTDDIIRNLLLLKTSHDKLVRTLERKSKNLSDTKKKLKDLENTSELLKSSNRKIAEYQIRLVTFDTKVLDLQKDLRNEQEKCATLLKEKQELQEDLESKESSVSSLFLISQQSEEKHLNEVEALKLEIEKYNEATKSSKKDFQGQVQANTALQKKYDTLVTSLREVFNNDDVVSQAPLKRLKRILSRLQAKENAAKLEAELNSPSLTPDGTTSLDTGIFSGNEDSSSLVDDFQISSDSSDDEFEDVEASVKSKVDFSSMMPSQYPTKILKLSDDFSHCNNFPENFTSQSVNLSPEITPLPEESNQSSQSLEKCDNSFIIENFDNIDVTLCPSPPTSISKDVESKSKSPGHSPSKSDKVSLITLKSPDLQSCESSKTTEKTEEKTIESDGCSLSKCSSPLLSNSYPSEISTALPAVITPQNILSGADLDELLSNTTTSTADFVRPSMTSPLPNSSPICNDSPVIESSHSQVFDLEFPMTADDLNTDSNWSACENNVLTPSPAKIDEIKETDFSENDLQFMFNEWNAPSPVLPFSEDSSNVEDKDLNDQLDDESDQFKAITDLEPLFPDDSAQQLCPSQVTLSDIRSSPVLEPPEPSCTEISPLDISITSSTFQDPSTSKASSLNLESGTCIAEEPTISLGCLIDAGTSTEELLCDRAVSPMKVSCRDFGVMPLTEFSRDMATSPLPIQRKSIATSPVCVSQDRAVSPIKVQKSNKCTSPFKIKMKNVASSPLKGVDKSTLVEDVHNTRERKTYPLPAEERLDSSAELKENVLLQRVMEILGLNLGNNPDIILDKTVVDEFRSAVELALKTVQQDNKYTVETYQSLGQFRGSKYCAFEQCELAEWCHQQHLSLHMLAKSKHVEEAMCSVSRIDKSQIRQFGGLKNSGKKLSAPEDDATLKSLTPVYETNGNTSPKAAPSIDQLVLPMGVTVWEGAITLPPVNLESSSEYLRDSTDKDYAKEKTDQCNTSFKKHEDTCKVKITTIQENSSHGEEGTSSCVEVTDCTIRSGNIDDLSGVISSKTSSISKCEEKLADDLGHQDLINPGNKQKISYTDDKVHEVEEVPHNSNSISTETKEIQLCKESTGNELETSAANSCHSGNNNSILNNLNRVICLTSQCQLSSECGNDKMSLENVTETIFQKQPNDGAEINSEKYNIETNSKEVVHPIMRPPSRKRHSTSDKTETKETELSEGSEVFSIRRSPRLKKVRVAHDWDSGSKQSYQRGFMKFVKGETIFVSNDTQSKDDLSLNDQTNPEEFLPSIGLKEESKSQTSTTKCQPSEKILQKSCNQAKQCMNTRESETECDDPKKKSPSCFSLSSKPIKTAIGCALEFNAFIQSDASPPSDEECPEYSVKAEKKLPTPQPSSQEVAKSVKRSIERDVDNRETSKRFKPRILETDLSMLVKTEENYKKDAKRELQTCNDQLEETSSGFVASCQGTSTPRAHVRVPAHKPSKLQKLRSSVSKIHPLTQAIQTHRTVRDIDVADEVPNVACLRNEKILVDTKRRFGVPLEESDRLSESQVAVLEKFRGIASKRMAAPDSGRIAQLIDVKKNKPLLSKSAVSGRTHDIIPRIETNSSTRKMVRNQPFVRPEHRIPAVKSDQTISGNSISQDNPQHIPCEMVNTKPLVKQKDRIASVKSCDTSETASEECQIVQKEATICENSFEPSMFNSEKNITTLSPIAYAIANSNQSKTPVCDKNELSCTEKIVKETLKNFVAASSFTPEVLQKAIDILSLQNLSYASPVIVRDIVLMMEDDYDSDPIVIPGRQQSFVPPLTPVQQQLLTLILQLSFQHKHFENLPHEVLRLIEYRMFRLGRAPPGGRLVWCSKLYASICRALSLRSHALIFCWDALYALKGRHYEVVKAVMEVWPHLFPINPAFNQACPNAQVMLHILHCHVDKHHPGVQISKPDNSWLKRLLKSSGLQSSSVNSSILASRIFSDMIGGGVHSNVTALLLLAKHEDEVWTFQNVVIGKLLPSLDQWRNGSLNDKAAERAVWSLCSILRAMSYTQVGDILKTLMKLWKSDLFKEAGSVSPRMQEVIAIGLALLARHDIENVAVSLMSWTPNHGSTIGYSSHLLQQISNLISNGIRPLNWWQERLQQISKSHLEE